MLGREPGYPECDVIIDDVRIDKRALAGTEMCISASASSTDGVSSVWIDWLSQGRWQTEPPVSGEAGIGPNGTGILVTGN